jgi:hypothetical protein
MSLNTSFMGIIKSFSNGLILPRWHRLALVCLLSLCQFVPSAALAGNNQWTGLGPDGGTVNSLVVDPSNPATLYAGTYGGVFKSINAGGSWSLANNGLSNSVYALAIDPQNPAILYAGGVGSVYKSTNGGGSWSSINIDNTSFAVVNTIAINPSNTSTLYVGTSVGVFKSTNGGGSWSQSNTGLTTTANVKALVMNPNTPNTLYAGTDSGVYKSTDGGGNWNLANTGLTSKPLSFFMVIDPSNPSTIYFGSLDGAFKSTDSGASWNPINVGLPSFLGVDALAIVASNPSMLYAVTYNGVFKTTNGGVNWSQVNSSLTNLTKSIVVDPSNPSILYLAQDNGVLKSVNGGGSWNQANTGLTATSIQSLAVDPNYFGTLYAGTSGNGVYKSINGGGSWSQTNNGLTSSYVHGLVLDPSNPSIVYAGADGVYKSSNGGQSWTSANVGLPTTFPSVSALAIAPSNPSTLYAGLTYYSGSLSNGLYKSTDGGGSWSAANTGLSTDTVSGLVVDPSTSLTVYARTQSNGVYKSTNGGASWSAVNTGLTSTYITSIYINALVIDPTTPSTLYAASLFGGVFKSTNGGGNWSSANTGMTAYASIDTLTIYPKTPSTLYAAGSGGMFKSLDSGANWKLLSNSSLNNAGGISALAVDPSNANTLYLGTHGSGVFKYTQSYAPVVSTGNAAGIISTSATLNGTVNPGGLTTTAQFEYGPTTAYGSTVGVTLSPNDGSTVQSVNAPISGLQAGATYHFRLTASNSQGTEVGNDAQFQTLKIDQAIFFGSPPFVIVGGTGMVSATGGASGNPVIFNTTITTVCTAGGTNGNTVTGVSAGSCIITADQLGNANYNDAPRVTQTFTIGKGNQTIALGAAPTVFVGGTGAVFAMGGLSGNPVIFTSTTTDICTVSGSTVTGVKVGNCTITADQTGNADYNPAPEVTQILSVTAGFALTVINGNKTFGTITSNVGGIACGAICSANFPYGASVTLTATPASSDYQFTGWGGACSGYGKISDKLTMDAAKSCTGSFELFKKKRSPSWRKWLLSQ